MQDQVRGARARRARARRAGQRAAGRRAQPRARSSTRSPGHVRLLYVAPERFSSPRLPRARCAAPTSACSSSTRRTASRSGATTSGPTTSGSPTPRAGWGRRRSWRRPRRRRRRWRPTSSRASGCATPCGWRRGSTARTSRFARRARARPRRPAHRGIAAALAEPGRAAGDRLRGHAQRVRQARRRAWAASSACASRPTTPGSRARCAPRRSGAFMAGESPVVVATNAFGMGVDKADVRTVCHESVPRLARGLLPGGRPRGARRQARALPAVRLVARQGPARVLHRALDGRRGGDRHRRQAPARRARSDGRFAVGMQELRAVSAAAREDERGARDRRPPRARGRRPAGAVAARPRASAASPASGTGARSRSAARRRARARRRAGASTARCGRGSRASTCRRLGDPAPLRRPDASRGPTGPCCDVCDPSLAPAPPQAPRAPAQPPRAARAAPPPGDLDGARRRDPRRRRRGAARRRPHARGRGPARRPLEGRRQVQLRRAPGLRHLRPPARRRGARARRRAAAGGHAALHRRAVPEARSRVRVGVLASGAGTNLQAILDTCTAARAWRSSRSARTSRRRRRSSVRAAAGVATAVFPRADYADRHGARRRDRRLARRARRRARRPRRLHAAPQRRTSSARFPQRVINVHPALLPAFPGIGAIEQALAYGVKVFGVTVHFVDEGVDTGPIILQRAVDLPAATDAERGPRRAAADRARAAVRGGAADRPRRGPHRPGQPAPRADRVLTIVRRR